MLVQWFHKIVQESVLVKLKRKKFQDLEKLLLYSTLNDSTIIKFVVIQGKKIIWKITIKNYSYYIIDWNEICNSAGTTK